MATDTKSSLSTMNIKRLDCSIAFEAIGTYWQIDSDKTLSHELIEKIAERIENFDKAYSRFRPDSLLASVAKQAGTYTFPDDAVPLIALYKSLYEITDGKVTPLIGQALERAGYDAAYSLTVKETAPVPPWNSVTTWKRNTLITTTPLTLDFGAAGKGYLIDLIDAILQENGHTNYVIDASGDILLKGQHEMVIGLEHPKDTSKVIGVIPVRNGSLCASAINRRKWGRGLHHIFDPHKVEPTRNIIATWVIAETALFADGIATALFFTNPTTLAQSFTFDYARMHQDGSVDYSSKFEGVLFT